jgi:hypothetical protein
MDTNTDFNQTLKKLSEQINQLSYTNNIKENTTSNKGYVLTIPNLSSPQFYYGIIPLSILCILYKWRPDFITITEVNDDGIHVKKLSYSKLIGWSLSFTALVAIAIFSYYYKQKKIIIQTSS